ncbi:MAG: hypothetical protein V1897_04800 [Pseudomonadota bacterium]
MKPKINLTAAVLPFALFVMVCLCFSPSNSHSQDLSSWFSSGTWWDWSDYRFKVEYRYFVPRLTSGSVSRNGTDYDLLASATGPNSTGGGYNFDPQPTPFNSAVFQLQVDRLGLRLAVEEDVIFRGIIGSVPFNSSSSSGPNDYIRVSELDLSSTRVGMALDLIRYPFVRGGIDFDWNVNSFTFSDKKLAVNSVWSPSTSTVSKRFLSTDPGAPPPEAGYYLLEYQDVTNYVYGQGPNRFNKSSSGPATIGLHVFAIPARVREVPIIAQAKINFPFPYWKQITSAQYEVRILEWEVMVGARPSVWDFSAFGHSTFSAGIEAGFRSVTIDAALPNATSLKAQWQGPFFQVGLYY